MSEHWLQEELDLAKQLARQAGAVAMRHYVSNFAVEFKGGNQSDPVTQADKDANTVIVSALSKAFPGDGILAEESPLSSERLSKQRLWCIDPIDGTREFVDRNGQFMVMIGLAIAGRAVLGVLYQPTEDALFWGLGSEAYVERQGVRSRLQVSLTHVPADARIVMSRSHVSKQVIRVADELGIHKRYNMGSVGLKVAQIAENKADIYLSFSNQTHEWDACAPEAVLTAAGGRMTDIYGAPLTYNNATTQTPNGILATNGGVHAALLQDAEVPGA